MSTNRPALAAEPRTHCSQCSLRDLCLPTGLSAGELDRIDQLVTTRRKVKRGEVLFHGGESFTSLYAVRTGFLKCTLVSPDGREQVTGFFMAGELVGMDGVGTEFHTGTVVALEDTEACVIPFARIEEFAREIKPLHRHFLRMMSRELTHDQGVMVLLGSMRAEERLATFLLNLSQRLARRGFSASEFVLRATREEIGSYLGLTLETVSRIFSRFHDDGLVSVRRKHIRILDAAGLGRLAGQPD